MSLSKNDGQTLSAAEVNTFTQKGAGETIADDWTFTSALEAQGNVNMPNLPTSDPLVTGRLWNDSGTVKVSA